LDADLFDVVSLAGFMLVSGRFRTAPFLCAAFRSFSQSSTNRLHPSALTDGPQPNARLEKKIMTSKHPKQNKPSDADLHRNPLIGGSKGTTMAHVTPDELEQLEGANTIEGDVENDTNPYGGIDKAEVRNARRGPPDHGREPGPHLAKGQHLGKGQAKGAGSGGMTDLQDEVVGENMVLSNRDKAEESGDRGQDGKWVKTEQLEDHAANKGRG
jgi:hypothetical protein